MLFFGKKEFIYSDLKLKDMLPVGTIVELYNREGLYMIQTYKGVIKSKDNKKLYYEIDYWCMPFVNGSTSMEVDPLPIMAKDIKKVVYEGYNSKERIEFLTELDSIQEVQR